MTWVICLVDLIILVLYGAKLCDEHDYCGC